MIEASVLELLIGTANQGKLREIRFALNGLSLKLHTLGEFSDISAPNESGKSYAENAIIKAQAYSDQTGLFALADDSGLEVDALDGGPGMLSARFGGIGISDTERTNLLLSKLSAVDKEKRQARFISVVAIAQPISGVINIGTGTCQGRIAREPRGKEGFGFDPVFVPDGHEITFAQMSWLLKNRISHRAKALRRTRQFLTQLLHQSLTPGLAGS